MPPKDLPVTRLAGSTVAPTPQNTPLVKGPMHQPKANIPDTINEQDLEQPIDVDGVSKKLTNLSDDDDEEEDDEDPHHHAMEEDEEEEEDLPWIVRKRVEGLKGVHAEFIKVEREYKKDLLALDRKYAERYRPIFDRRGEIIKGTAEPTNEEIKLGEEQSKEDEPDAETFGNEPPADEPKVDAKGVPEFWLTVLQNHPEIGQTITPRDEKALESLTDIHIEYLPAENPGYKFTFHFSENDFFTDEALTKTYHYQDEVDYFGDYVYSAAQGCKINWKEDKDLTQTFEVRKQRNKNTNRTRTIKKAVATPSFFDFFNPPVQPDPHQTFTPEALEALEDRLERDYQVGEDLKDEVIPRAVDYFTGKALDYNAESLDGLDEGEWDEDDSDQSNEPSMKVRRKVTTGKTNTDSADCKNQ